MSRRLAIIEGQRAALAYAMSDPDQARRIRALEAENAALRRRLAGGDVPQQPDPLAAHNEELRAAGERLRDTIGALLEANPGPPRGAAKRVLRAMAAVGNGTEELPTIRCVQHHITALRKAAAGHGQR